MAEQLVGRGFAVYALDLRGRGYSDGERFYVDHVGEYESDLYTFQTPISGATARTRSVNGIVNSDWFVTVGGDGFQTRPFDLNDRLR